MKGERARRSSGSTAASAAIATLLVGTGANARTSACNSQIALDGQQQFARSLGGVAVAQPGDAAPGRPDHHQRAERPARSRRPRQPSMLSGTADRHDRLADILDRQQRSAAWLPSSSTNTNSSTSGPIDRIVRLRNSSRIHDGAAYISADDGGLQKAGNRNADHLQGSTCRVADDGADDRQHAEIAEHDQRLDSDGRLRPAGRAPARSARRRPR